MKYTDQQQIEKTFKFFDMAAVERMLSHSNDMENLVECDDVELIDADGEARLVFSFSRQAMDGNGYHVGTETCVVTFITFDASTMMYVHPNKLGDYPLHGRGVTLDLREADFDIEPAREEIPWEEIYRENASPEHHQLLDEYKADLYTPAFVGQDDPDPIDEEDFCAWMQEKHDIDVDREAYFDAYNPPDDDFWFQEVEYKFDKLKDHLRSLVWKFNPDHEKEESEPWYLENKSESESSSLTP